MRNQRDRENGQNQTDHVARLVLAIGFVYLCLAWSMVGNSVFLAQHPYPDGGYASPMFVQTPPWLKTKQQSVDHGMERYRWLRILVSCQLCLAQRSKWLVSHLWPWVIPLASTTEATQADLKLIPIPARVPHALSDNACCMAMFLKFQVHFSDVIALFSELLQFWLHVAHDRTWLDNDQHRFISLSLWLLYGDGLSTIAPSPLAHNSTTH